MMISTVPLHSSLAYSFYRTILALRQATLRRFPWEQRRASIDLASSKDFLLAHDRPINQLLFQTTMANERQ
eukprot:scaffold15532_cov73-Skeletonema_marinoi.AAC.1